MAPPRKRGHELLEKGDAGGPLGLDEGEDGIVGEAARQHAADLLLAAVLQPDDSQIAGHGHSARRSKTPRSRFLRTSFQAK